MTGSRLALVIIGRNEARHLAISLPAIRQRFETIVYVDSGSTDGSQALAREYGAEVIDLDTSRGFTAARARNAGIEFLLRQPAPVNFVQFIDGDCELLDEFVDGALAWLQSNPTFAVCCGRRRERFPDATIYNQLCDIEWDTPVGEALYCGGDALMRLDALEQVGGYNPDLIAGEEPDLCVRLRQKGWKIYRIDLDMTLHDAAMTSMTQWWKRNLRSGYAFAMGADLHGAPPELHWVRETRSNWIWGGIFLCALVCGVLVTPFAFLMLGGFALLTLKIGLTFNPPHSRTREQKLLYGLNCALGKVPQFFGQAKFKRDKLEGKSGKIIEYK